MTNTKTKESIRTLKKYDVYVPLYGLSYGDKEGFILKMPKDSIFRSIECYTSESCTWGEIYTEFIGKIWMEVDERQPIVERRFRLYDINEEIEPYMEYVGMLSFEGCPSYLLYEFTIDYNDMVRSWKNDRYHNLWYLDKYAISVVNETDFDKTNLFHCRLWNLRNDDDYIYLIEDCKDDIIPNKIVKYIKKKYKTIREIKEILNNGINIDDVK